jgi:hypothetical protein
MDAITTTSRFILVGDAQNYFDYNNLPKNNKNRQLFMCLLVKENYENAMSQMMLMIKDNPHKSYEDALLKHMRQKGLLEINVSGGGFIWFSEDMTNCSITGCPYLFKSMVYHDAATFLKTSIPSIIGVSGNQNTIKVAKYHKLYTLSEIIKFSSARLRLN